MILNLLIEDPGTESGWLALEDPEAGLRLGANTLANTSSTVKRVSASNPYIPGTYTVRSVADNHDETVEVQVLDASSVTRKQKVDYLVGLFTRASYRLRLIVDQPGTAIEVVAQAADWQLNNQAEFMHYGMTVATFTFTVLPTWQVVTHTAAVPLPEGSSWYLSEGVPQVPEHDHPHEHSQYLTDAPIDEVTYARRDGMWVPAAEAGGGADYVLKSGDTMTGQLVQAYTSGYSIHAHGGVRSDDELWVTDGGVTIDLGWLSVNGGNLGGATISGGFEVYHDPATMPNRSVGFFRHDGGSYAPLMASQDHEPITKAYFDANSAGGAGLYGEHLVTWSGSEWRYRGATVTVRPATAAYADGGRVVWDTSTDATVTTPPALAVTGDAWLPHGDVDPLV